jgi:hypothetical protein
MLPYLHLLRENVIPYLLSCLPIIGPPPEHKLIPDDPKSEVIHSTAMILPTHDLRRHVSRCPRSVLRVFRSPNARDTQICEAHVAVLIHHHVFRLDVAMDHTIVVHVLQTHYHAGEHKLYMYETV